MPLQELPRSNQLWEGYWLDPFFIQPEDISLCPRYSVNSRIQHDSPPMEEPVYIRDRGDPNNKTKSQRHSQWKSRDSSYSTQESSKKKQVVSGQEKS